MLKSLVTWPFCLPVGLPAARFVGISAGRSHLSYTAHDACRQIHLLPLYSSLHRHHPFGMTALCSGKSHTSMYSSLGGGGRGRTCVFAGIPAGCYRYTTLPVGAFRAAPDPWSDLGGYSVIELSKVRRALMHSSICERLSDSSCHH